MEIKKRVSSLSYEQVRNLLRTNFIKVGISVRTDNEDLEIVTKEVIRFHSNLWIETLEDAFSFHAAGKLKLGKRAELSGAYITEIRHAHFNMFEDIKKESKPKLKPLTETELAYSKLCRFIDFYGIYPANPDWQLVLKYLVENKHLAYYKGWETTPYGEREQDAKREVRAWIKENAKIIFKKRFEQKIAA